jgi:hypothetical protein
MMRAANINAEACRALTSLLGYGYGNLLSRLVACLEPHDQPPASEPKDTRCPSQMDDGGCNESPEVDKMRERIAELEAEVERLKGEVSVLEQAIEAKEATVVDLCAKLKARPVAGMPTDDDVDIWIRRNQSDKTEAEIIELRRTGKAMMIKFGPCVAMPSVEACEDVVEGMDHVKVAAIHAFIASRLRVVKVLTREDMREKVLVVFGDWMAAHGLPRPGLCGTQRNALIAVADAILRGMEVDK